MLRIEDHGDPNELLQKYQELNEQIISIRNSLKKELMDALGEKT